MENIKWEERLQALTHILTHPTTTPSLHSQLFISTQLPSHYNLDYYPPIYTPKHTQLTWAFSLFLNKVSRFGLPQTSWRSKCPYQVPPPLILAKGVEEAKWGDAEKREYVSKRMRKRRLGNNVNPLIPILVPNMTPVEMSFGLESMLPYHTATASALLTSMLSVSPRTFAWTPQDCNDDL